MRVFTFFLILGMVYTGHCQTDYTSFFSSAELAAANTAAKTDYLTQDEKDMFLYSNLARMYPRKFSTMYVAFCQNSGKSDLLRSNHYYASLKTDLDNRQPVGALYPDKLMFELAECWAIEAGKKGIVGHDRITCEGGYSGENCSYGYSNGLDIIMQLLVDYGVESLGHRWNILNGGYKGLGVAIRPHSGYRFNAVMDFAWTNDELRVKAANEEREREIRQQESARKLEERIAEFGQRMAQWSEEEKNKADVCRQLTYLNEVEKDFYFYANLIRLYPQKFKKLLWDDGPYFDFMPEDLQESVHEKDGYKNVTAYLQSASPLAAIIPQESKVKAARCVANGFRNGEKDLLKCLSGGGGYKVQSFFEAEPYKDVMEALMNKDVFNAVVKQEYALVIDGGMRAMVR